MAIENHYCYSGGALACIPGEWPGGCIVQVDTETGQVVDVLSIATGQSLRVPDPPLVSVDDQKKAKSPIEASLIDKKGEDK